MTDAINPSHYKQGSIECIEAMEQILTPEEFRGYLKGNVLKYLWREREKKGIEDLRKAKWYLDRLVNRDQLAEVVGAIPDLPIEEPKPSRTQPPRGYRMLADAKIEPRCADDLYWSDSHKHWAPIGFQMSYANAHNWAACRKIEPPSKNPTETEPPKGWRWIDVGELFCDTDSTNTVDAIPSAWAGTVCAVKHVAFRKIEKPSEDRIPHRWRKMEIGEDIDQDDKFWYEGRWVSYEKDKPPIPRGKLTDFHVTHIRKIEEPPKRYREPTQADLANGPIECEYRDDDNEQWRSGLLVYMLEGAQPFVCVSKELQVSNDWEQCRIEVQG